jgi:hypothetical protein
MFEPLWKKMGGVLTDLAAVAVAMAATVHWRSRCPAISRLPARDRVIATGA